jgi:sensor histidine kinase regulating citrate/malate metabolism
MSGSVKTAYQLNTLKTEHQYYEGKLKDEERVRAVYHDMKNHLLLLKAENGGRNTEIIESIEEQISGYENYFDTGNILLDVIIREKAERAREYEIDFSAMLRFERGCFIEPTDISAIFGNALDNAVEASLKLPVSRRLITAKADCVHDLLTIRIENHTADEVGPEMKSTKKDKLFHGFGYKSIEQAVAKYGGQVSCKHMNGRFILSIVIPIP